MLRLLVHLQALVAWITHPPAGRRSRSADRPTVRTRRFSDAGQTTAEYALVLLAAAAIAALLIAWATRSGAIGKLFDAVLDHVIGSVT